MKNKNVVKKKIVLTQTKTFTRTATLEIPLPDDIEYENIEDWIYENNHEFLKLEEKVMEAPLMTDPDFDNHLRYDIYEEVVLQKQVYGGNL